MKPHVQIILLFLLLPFSNLGAQLSTFDLSKYKTADYERRTLTFSGNLSGGYAEDKSESENTDNSSYDKDFNSNLDLGYSLIKNTRKKQQDFQLGISLNPKSTSFNSDRSASYAYKRVESNNSGRISFSSNNRLYLTEKRFFEIDASGSLYGVYTNYSKKNTDNYADQRSLNSNVIVPVKLGVGRLENIDDARLAIFILEDMHKNQQLNKEITDDDILLFASKITKLKNQRHFDQRKRRIYEIQSLDSFLRENAFTSAQNALFFSTLIDNWGYANNPFRQAGTRFSLGAAPQFNYLAVNDISVEKTKNIYQDIDLFAEMYASKPLSLKWQRDIGLKGGFIKSGTKNKYGFDYDSNEYLNEIESKTDQLYFSGDWGYGFYPNSRTFMNTSLHSNLSKNWISHNPTSSFNTREYWRYNISFSLNGYYYFSERLSLNYNFTTGYQKRNSESKEDTTKYHNFATNFNVSFAYSIF